MKGNDMNKKILRTVIGTLFAATMCFGMTAFAGDGADKEEIKGTSYKFEAEHTDLSVFFGRGYSNETTGVGAICYDKYQAGASNDYFICDMYDTSSFISFTIESSEDVENVTLILRATA